MSGQAYPALGESALSGPLVGRAREIGTAWTVLDLARRGRGQVLGVTGGPGVGKSRLAAEIGLLARRLGFEVHAGACRADGTTTTTTTTAYLVWQPIWRALFAVDPSLEIAEQRVRLRATIAGRDRGSDERAPLLAPVVDLPMPDSDLTAPLEPQARTDLLRSLLLDQVRMLAAATPLLLVLEDCHWIDPASRALLDFLARNLADRPVLLVATSRPPEQAAAGLAALAFLPHFTELRVGDLLAEDAERLVAQRIRSLRGEDGDVPPAVVRQIVAWAGGNPFHLEELVAFLLAGGTDPLEPGVLAGLDRPEDLRRLVLARTERLDAGEKATIEVASVIGERFAAAWIRGSHPAAGTPEQVRRHLERLAELDLTRQFTNSPEPEYAFKHAITREAVYESLSAHERAALHEAVASYLERAHADRLSQLVHVLAHHYQQTPNIAKRREWLQAAANAARGAFATDSAIGYYEALLALLPAEQTGEPLVELGDLLRLASRWADAERAYTRALAVAGASDRRVRAAATRGLGSVLPYTRPAGQALRQAVDRLGEAVMEFQRLEDWPGLAATLERLAWTSWELGDFDGALAASEQQLTIATRAGDLVGVSAALENKGVVRWLTGNHAAALPLLEEALEVATGARYRPGVILAANDLGGVCFEDGDHVRAIRHFRRALSVAEEIGDRRMAARVIGNLGEAHRRQGEYGRAVRCFGHAFRAAAEIGDRPNMMIQAGNLAMAVAAQGREPEAEQLYARVVRLARQLAAQYALCEWLHQQARFLAAAGRPREAERANREALEIAAEHGQAGVELRARLLSLRLQVQLGRRDRGDAVRELRVLRNDRVDPPEQAAVLDALWQLDPSQEQARQEAAGLYRMLHERAPTVEYQEAYERLAGVTLPPGPPLPPPPPGVGRAPLDVAQVLEQLDLAVQQTRSESSGEG